MMDQSSCTAVALTLLIFSLFTPCRPVVAGTGNSLPAVSFSEKFVVSWAPSNVKFLGSHGEALQLLLDNSTGSGFASKDSYLFGNIDMQIKLVPGDSAGTVTAYYLSSEGTKHDELDFEFLGNLSGQPYVLQTNVFANGEGGREQRIRLWFDPTASFHTYSVAWSGKRVLFLVDGIPIRVYSNNEKVGVPFLSRQPMRVFSSIWNGDSWATRGGLVKINWAHAPFVATYRNFRANACIATSASAPSIVACSHSPFAAAGGSSANHITASGAPGFDRAKLNWVKRNFMVYDYCTDSSRYHPSPAECSREF